ncbi:[FeFe] hydrogenase H-cluster radical SAM maturase HydE [Gottschalkiaceae bacterium SANA]|nr:[FeFe] hydrogenase H-cluster radical SAM maturase HydE [Gottschalkiaceae bacterium SANA]
MNWIEKLTNERFLTREEWRSFFEALDDAALVALKQQAIHARRDHYGLDVYMRGLIEFTNYCKRDCLYCGIRRSNKSVERYRLTEDQILTSCDQGYWLGYRTFVLQGGEDPYYTEDRIVSLVKRIKATYPDCAITLSVGEWPRSAYQAFYAAGADRYLLRHEAASPSLYASLHQGEENHTRLQSLQDLKEIGFQIGAGFMVGAPGQTQDDLIDDLLFLQELQPHMVGIGPFLPQSDTPLANANPGTLEMTCLLLSIIRLILPDVLLPATTALGSVNPHGREQGLLAGANVVMPNLSPTSVRELYALYDGKICTGDEAAHCRQCIEGRIASAGFRVNMTRGDHSQRRKKNDH